MKDRLHIPKKEKKIRGVIETHLDGINLERLAFFNISLQVDIQKLEHQVQFPFHMHNVEKPGKKIHN